MADVKQTDLYKKIDDLVRHHDRREPYATNAVMRIYSLVTGGLPPERVNSQSDYRKGYSAGYAAAKKRFQPPQSKPEKGSKS